ncbi:uncharacterized protein LOC143036508 [Oratosquilla oratoria]|uniref:uncharacterized protein LOC143036508 n=1 Tax=Oratosquilla oratoria TaxID=337810 RepID=UPI003F771903
MYATDRIHTSIVSLTSEDTRPNNFTFNEIKPSKTTDDHTYTEKAYTRRLRKSKTSLAKPKKGSFTSSMTQFKNTNETTESHNDIPSLISNSHTLQTLHKSTRTLSPRPSPPRMTLTMRSMRRRSTQDSIRSSRVSIIKPSSISISSDPASLLKNEKRALKTRPGHGVFLWPSVLRGLGRAATRDNNANNNNNNKNNNNNTTCSDINNSNSLAHEPGESGDNGSVCRQGDVNPVHLHSGRILPYTESDRSSNCDAIGHVCSSDVVNDVISEVRKDRSTNGKQQKAGSHISVPVDSNDRINNNKTNNGPFNGSEFMELGRNFKRIRSLGRNENDNERSNGEIVHSDFVDVTGRPDQNKNKTLKNNKSCRNISMNNINSSWGVFYMKNKKNKNIISHKNTKNRGRLAGNNIRKGDIRLHNSVVMCISDKNVDHRKTTCISDKNTDYCNTATSSKPRIKRPLYIFRTHRSIRINKNARTNQNKHRKSYADENYLNTIKYDVDKTRGKMNQTNTVLMDNCYSKNSVNVSDMCASSRCALGTAIRNETGKHKTHEECNESEYRSNEGNRDPFGVYREIRNNKNIDPSYCKEGVDGVGVRDQDTRQNESGIDTNADDITGASFGKGKQSFYVALLGTRPEDTDMTSNDTNSYVVPGRQSSSSSSSLSSSSREEETRKEGRKGRNLERRAHKDHTEFEVSVLGRAASKALGSSRNNIRTLVPRLLTTFILVHLLASVLGVASATTVHDRHITWGRAPAPSPSSPLSSSSNSSNSSSSSTLTDLDPSQNASVPEPRTVFRKTSRNVTAVIGHTARLPCSVVNLGLKEVSWIRHRDLHILTVSYITYTNDDRFKVHHVEGSEDWVLEISSVAFADAGVYECQVSTSPKIFLPVHLNVLGVSRARIPGPESIYVRAGSTIRLQCELKAAEGAVGPITWLRDDAPLDYSEMRGGVVTEVERTSVRTMSQLSITRAAREDSGNYTCDPRFAWPASVAVHVLPDEESAAVQSNASLGWREVRWPIWLLWLLGIFTTLLHSPVLL